MDALGQGAGRRLTAASRPQNSGECRLRITFIMPADDLSGGNRVVATYARIFRARGHAVHVVSSGSSRPSLREQLRVVRRGGWHAWRRQMRSEPGHIALSGVPQTILERARPITADDLPDADVLVATWWETAVWMAPMPPSKGRQVHLIQGYECWGEQVDLAELHAALRLPNCKIAISAGLKREIEAALGNLDIRVVPNAVDHRQFDSPPRSRGEPPTVGYIYSGASIKGADRCLAAIALAREALPELRVLAFGSELPSAELAVPPGAEFSFRPPQECVAALYARCDAWLFCSRQDSFGLPILEAMACRTPVIGVPVGAAPELLAAGAGVLVDAPGEEALIGEVARALIRLCQQPAAEWLAISERAYARAREYCWEDAATLLLAILEKA